MKRKQPSRLKGKWRIVEMPTWPAAHLDTAGPAYIELDGKGRGELAFGALTATLDCATTPSGVDFDWHGFDEGTEVAGEGWVELQSDGSLIGEFAYDNGDEYSLNALPWGVLQQPAQVSLLRCETQAIVGTTVSPPPVIVIDIFSASVYAAVR